MKTLTLLLCLALTTCKNSQDHTAIDTQSPDYKAYMAQQHRFALNGCQLTYNEKPFTLGMSLQEFKTLFGAYTLSGHDNMFIESNTVGISGTIKNDSIYSIAISFEKGINYIKIDNAILVKTDLMQDFIVKSSKYSFEDFTIKSGGYSYKYENCNYYFKSKVAYERIGSGHIYMSGDWKLDETNPVNYINIYKLSE